MPIKGFTPSQRRAVDFGGGDDFELYTQQDQTFNGVKLNDADADAFLALLNNHTVPVHHDIKAQLFDCTKDGEIKRFNAYSTAAFLRFAFGACLIDNAPAWLEYPKGDTRNNNLYLSGTDGLTRTLSHLWRDVSSKDVTAVLTALRAQLLNDDAHSFRSDTCTFVTEDGTIFRVNPLAETEADVVDIIDHIEPDDHVLAGSFIPVSYDPSITSHAVVDDMLDAWSDGDEARRARIIEAHYSVPMVKLRGANKGCVVDADYVGGTGKSVNSRIMSAFLGNDAVCHVSVEALGNSRFALGQAAPAKVIYDDELTDHILSQSAAATLKALVTGSCLNGEVKGVQQLIDCFGQSVILSTNHPFRPSQSEAILGAWLRRLCVIHWKHVFDTGDPDTSTADNSLETRVTDDPAAMSYILNLALDGLRRFVVNGWYTPVPEDDQMAREMLMGVDTVARFLEEHEPYGIDWKTPRLVPFGHDGRKTALVFPVPMWDDAKTYYSRLKSQVPLHGRVPHADTLFVYNCRTGDIDTSLPLGIDAVGFANDIQMLYGEYQAWHATQGTGSKGCLSLQNFVENLKRKGYARYRAFTQLLGGQRRFLVPADVTDAATFRRFLADIKDAHLGSHTGPSYSTVRKWREFAKSTLAASPSGPTDDTLYASDGKLYVSDDDLAQLSQDQLFDLARVAIGLSVSGLLN